MRTGRRFPRHLVVQADNTVAQAKNQWVALWLAQLVRAGLFETCNLFFLRVGHTHEDIDQLFSILVSLILRCHHFQTPQELLDFLMKELQPKFEAKREECHGKIVTGIRDWQSWLLGLHRSLTNCWANRKQQEAPHAFAFKQGRCISDSEAEWLGGRSGDQAIGSQIQSDAVYCCIKEFMGSRDLKQAPVLVLPAERRLATPLPEHVNPRIGLSAATINNYTKLACKCQEFNLPHAAQGLQDLMFDLSYNLDPLTWLTEDRLPYRWLGEADDPRHRGNTFFPHLPGSSFNMLAHDRR